MSSALPESLVVAVKNALTKSSQASEIISALVGTFPTIPFILNLGMEETKMAFRN